MPAKVFHGARALFQIMDPLTGPKILGIFQNVSYALTYDVSPAYVLGRYSAAELGYTAMEPVQVTATGWRVINHGPHADSKVPHLQDLLLHEYIELQVLDRQTNLPIAKIHSCRPTGYSETITNRQLADITVTFVGLLVDDESGANTESVPAGDLP